MTAVAVAVVGGVFTLLTAVLAQNHKIRNESRKTSSALHQGMCVLMRNQLVNDHRHLIGKGYITVEEFTSYTATHKLYTELGGNGVVSHLVSEVQKLPILNQEG